MQNESLKSMSLLLSWRASWGPTNPFSRVSGHYSPSKTVLAFLLFWDAVRRFWTGLGNMLGGLLGRCLGHGVGHFVGHVDRSLDSFREGF